MPLHPLATQFGAVAESYERGRPGYPPPVIEAIAAGLALEPGARVLDLAAGTGKMTRGLLAGGFDVVAVEPQAPLRALLAAAVGPERAFEGLAEAIPFGDGEFAAITVGDGFHWFDAAPALAEMRRVLRPGGGLALSCSAPAWEAMPWSTDVGRLLAGLRTEHPFFDGTPCQETLRMTAGWAEPRDIRVSTVQRLRVADYLASMSWVAVLEPAVREPLLARVEALTGPEVDITVHANITLSARG